MKGKKKQVQPAGPVEESPKPSPYPNIPGKWPLHLLLYLLLVGGTCLLYQGDVHLGYFNVDDPTYIQNNPWIRSVSAENLKQIWTEPYFANFSPMHLTSYMVDNALGGGEASVFHLSSNVWAGVCAGGVYLLALLLTGHLSIALAAGLLFMVHPAHVEAVAWISSRKDLVSTAFTIPAMCFYFLYRRKSSLTWFWYSLSLLFFFLGIAGKLSVVVVPGVLFLFDVLVEKRKDWGLVLDKIPMGLIVLLFTIPTWGVQPPTRHAFDFYVVGRSMVQNVFLLTGFGDYLLYRPKNMAGMTPLVATFYVLFPVLLAVLPLLLRRWLSSFAVVLMYWAVLAFIPSQVLSFVYPVTDRYLFFPSVAAVLLIAWGLVEICGRLKVRWSRSLAWMVLLVIGLVWLYKTWVYLEEWQDPRSVWYANVQKVDDVNASQYLGSHYQDAADFIAARLEDPRNKAQAIGLAREIWKDHADLEVLIAEWNEGNSSGPTTRAYQTALRERAREQFERAVQLMGTRVKPNVFFRMGKLAMDTGNLDEAVTAFRTAYTESQKHTYEKVRQELAVRSHHALGIVYWRKRDYPEALRWYRLAEQEQQKSGRVWIPDITAQRQRVERLAGLGAK